MILDKYTRAEEKSKSETRKYEAQVSGD